MNLHIVLNGNPKKSFGAMNEFASRCRSQCRHVKSHGALYSKVVTAGDSR